MLHNPAIDVIITQSEQFIDKCALNTLNVQLKRLLSELKNNVITVYLFQIFVNKTGRIHLSARIRPQEDRGFDNKILL